MATTSQESHPISTPHHAMPSLLVLFKDAFGRPEGRITLFGAAAGVAFLTLIFWTNLRHFLLSWSTDENYSHGFLVPFISLYFANLAAERGAVRVRGGAFLGAVLIALALMAKLATETIVFGTLGDIALVVAIAGLCSLFAGLDALRRYWFAIAFLVFMIPLPVALYAMVASPLQLLVSQVASVILNATGVPVLTEGNMMTLPGDVKMFVAEACSGLRQLTGFLALTAAVAYLSSRPIWYRLTLIASSVPIAMFANVARVILTGYIMYFVNPEYASGTYHTLEGLLMLGVGLSLLRLECWVLDQCVALTAAEEPLPEEGDAANESDVPPNGTKPHSILAPTPLAPSALSRIPHAGSRR